VAGGILHNEDLLSSPHTRYYSGAPVIGDEMGGTYGTICGRG
jgi:hypothetical protein